MGLEGEPVTELIAANQDDFGQWSAAKNLSRNRIGHVRQSHLRAAIRRNVDGPAHPPLDLRTVIWRP